MNWYNSNPELIEEVRARMKLFIAANPETEMFEKEDIEFLIGNNT